MIELAIEPAARPVALRDRHRKAKAEIELLARDAVVERAEGDPVTVGGPQRVGPLEYGVVGVARDVRVAGVVERRPRVGQVDGAVPLRARPETIADVGEAAAPAVLS